MRNPQAWRNVALTLAASGIGLAAYRWSQPTGVATEDAQVAAMVYAMLSIPFGLITALVLHQQVRAQRALRSGTDLIARWRVLGPDWRQFLALSKDFDFNNEIAPRGHIPRTGIEVIASKRAIMVDGDIVMLDGTTRVTNARLSPGAPTCVDLDLVIQTRSGRLMRRMVFPVPQAVLGQAQALVDYFNGMEVAHLEFVYGPGGRRVMGWVLMGLGFLCTVGMVLVLRFLLPSLLQPGVDVGGTRFDGTADQAQTMMIVMGAIFVACLGLMGFGAYTVIAQRKYLREGGGPDMR